MRGGPTMTQDDPINIRELCVSPSLMIRVVINRMNAIRRGIALVVDEEQRLIGAVTDGDVRRAILANVDLGAPVSELLARKAGSRYARPIMALVGENRNTYLNLLKQHNILYLPLVDKSQRVAGLVTLDEFLPDQALPLQAVVMAGGKGSRLYPLTKNVPKPMLRVGNRPLLEIIIRQLREAGIRRVKVTTHHQFEKIAEHFGDGSGFGVEISYVEENQPLGTVGGFGLLEPPKDTTLVINGDILTQVDFRAMLLYHREHEADLTVAVRQYDVRVPYGVIECDGAIVRKVSEKPMLNFFINAGIYLLEPLVYRYLSGGEPLDMTDLIQRLLDDGRTVVSFPVREYWLDIGQREDYEQAQAQGQQWNATSR